MPAIADNDYWESYSNLQRIKHDLIRQYLGGWLPKLTLGQTGAKRVIYFDTHAGCGRHSRGQLGSPLVALETIVRHACFSRLQNSEVRFVFIERDQANMDQLVGEIKAFGTLPVNVQINATCGNSFDILGQLLSQIEQQNTRLDPSFIFCDPFGFKVPGSLLKRLMKQKRVELFVNIIWRELDMAIIQGQQGNASLASTLDLIFDGPEWRTISAQANLDERAEQCVQLIRSMTGAQWATYIRMLGDNGNTRYFLLHLTNHDAGRDLMKECMWKCCPAEGYYARKTDNPAQQMLIKPEPDLRPLRAWVFQRLSSGPKRWQMLHDEVRPEMWLPTHVTKVVRELRHEKLLEGTDYQKSFNPANNPLLHLTGTGSRA